MYAGKDSCCQWIEDDGGRRGNLGSVEDVNDLYLVRSLRNPPFEGSFTNYSLL